MYYAMTTKMMMAISVSCKKESRRYQEGQKPGSFVDLFMMSSLTTHDNNHESLRKELEIARKELKNIRQELHKQKSVHEKEVNNIKQILKDALNTSTDCHKISKYPVTTETTKSICNMRPIGYIKSWFKSKNGTPRQPVFCPLAKAFLKIEKSVFSNPEHSLIGLAEFSYVWILFVFHENKDLGNFQKAKVHPPRLNGTSVGVFSTRSPHRPNAIGLSLTKLEKIEGDTLFLSGVDILDGTPVLDIKPFIPSYDMPYSSGSSSTTRCQETANQINQMHEIIYKETKVTGTEAQDLLSESCRGFSNCEPMPTDSSGNRKNSRKENFPPVPSEFNKICPENFHNCDSGQIKLDSNHKNFEKSVTHLSCQEKNTDSCCEKSVSNEIVLLNCVKSTSLVGDATPTCSVASWLKTPPVSLLDVGFTSRALGELEKFHSNGSHKGKCQFCFSFLESTCKAKLAIIELLQQDPRSVYRRKNCMDRLYYFCVDVMHITCWFDDDSPSPFVQVLKIKPVLL